MCDKLRQIQLCELDILTEIARICEKNNIDYWLAYGTMLGAVRHKGFIPWDDDIDIYMTMDGFRKFQKCCKKDLQPQYFLQTPESDPTMIWLYFKMRKNGTQMLEPGQVPNPDGRKHFGIWVDIFPLIEVADTDKNHEKQLEILRKLQYLRGQWIAVGAQKTVKNFIKKIINKTLRIYEKLLWSRVLSMGRKSSGLMLVIENEFYEGASESFVKKCHYSSKFFADGQEYTFEDFKFRGISDYDKYLSYVYSSDYMTPKRYNAHVEDYSQVIV